MQKDRFLSIQKLRREFNSINPQKTASHCTVRSFVAQHNIIYRAAARKLMLRAKTSQERLSWLTETTAWSQLLGAVFVYGRVQIRVTQRRSGLGSQKSERKIKHSLYVNILQRSSVASLLGCNCLRSDGAPHQSTRKVQLVGLHPHFGGSWSSVLPDLWYKLVDENAPIHRS